MTPKEKYFPHILERIKPPLVGAGFKLKGAKFFKQASDDVEIMIWPMIMGPTEDGCLDVRLVCWVYSDEFARKAIRHEGPKDYCAAAIDLEVSRLRRPQDRIMWHICSDERAMQAGQEMLELLTQYLLPMTESWNSVDGIVDALEEHGGLLADVGSKGVEARLERFRESRSIG